MAAKKKTAPARKSGKPREINPVKDKYQTHDRSGNPNVPGANFLKGTHWAKYAAQPGSNVPMKTSWPKGGGVSSSPAPAMPPKTRAKFQSAVNAELRAQEVRRELSYRISNTKKNKGRKNTR